MKQRKQLRLETLEQRTVLAAVGVLDAELRMVEREAPRLEPVEKAPTLSISADARDLNAARPVRPTLEAYDFVAALRGENEVPPVDTDARGLVRLHLTRDASALRFQLALPRLEGLRAAHIHLGAADENGPVAVTLFALDSSSADINGVALRGVVDDEQIAELPELDFDGTLASLVEALRSGNAYVNVHTDAYPDGELRGQLRGIGMRPRHNPVNRMDVDGDNAVTPRDAVIIVNEMNHRGASLVELPTDDAIDYKPPYMDTSGDNVISPSDVLQLVNFMNLRGDLGADRQENLLSDTVRDVLSAIDFNGLRIPDIDTTFLDELVKEGGRVDQLLDKVETRVDRVYAELIQTPPEDLRAAIDDTVEEAKRLAERVRESAENLQPDVNRLVDSVTRRWRDLIG